METRNLVTRARLMRAVIRLVSVNTSFGLSVMGVFALLMLAPASFAQEVPEDILREIQKQQNGAPQNERSPVDLARDGQRDTAVTAPVQTAPMPPSRIEIDYRERSDSENLGQYGYELFAYSPEGRLEDPVGRVDDEYVLGIGDEIVVTLIGGTSRSIITQVDSEGRVVLPDLRPISAAGRTFGAFRRDLEAQVTANLLGAEAFVSIGSVRQVGVLVLGEVDLPGMHHLTSLSSVLDALTAAGIRKTGSLRSIQIHAAGQITSLDIYDLLQGKVGSEIRLQEGMRIVVPVIGTTVAVEGEVMRPGIYELNTKQSEISYADMISMAGGFLRPLGNEVTSNELQTDGRQLLRSVDVSSGIVPAGSILSVSRKKNLISGRVGLAGHVGVVGSRSLEGAGTLAELVGGLDGLGRSPYLLFAILETKDAATQSRLLKAVDLERILAGAEDVALRDEDTLYVLSAHDVAFLSSPDIRNALLTKRPSSGSCPAIQNFASQILETDIHRYSSVVRSIFISREDAGPAEVKRQGAKTPDDTVDLDTVASGELVGGREGVISLDTASEEDDANCSALFDEFPDLLAFTLEHAVSATGAVRRPGIYPLAGSTSISSLVSVSGGFANNADLQSIEMLSFSGRDSEGALRASRKYIDATAESLARFVVSPGNSVRFDSILTDQEPGSVLLSGEFGRPGVYSITRGETLGQILERAGGLTEQAYPYGAELRRVSVKREQEEAFRRASRELNSALASLVLRRRDITADAIVATQQLADNLASVEAPGRVVVEADPAVLRTRPELDVVLEPGDSILMPKRPSFVIVVGDVLSPGALQFIPGKEVDEYLEQSGGLQSSADKKRVFVVYPNGVAAPVNVSRWAFSTLQIPPGSTLVVPKDSSPLTMEIVRDISGIFGQLALAAASLAVVVSN